MENDKLQLYYMMYFTALNYNYKKVTNSTDIYTGGFVSSNNGFNRNVHE